MKTDAAPIGQGGPSGLKPKLLWLWVALAAVIVLAGGIAIVSSGDDEELTVGSTVPAGADDASESTDADETEASDESDEVEVAEVWPVTIDGTPLESKPDGDDPAIGTTAPKLSGFTFDGTPIEVDPSEGPVMLVFLAHWCPHCNREIPELLAWRDAGGVPDDLQVIAVTTAVDPSAPNYPPSEWIPAMEWTWPVLADSEASEAARAFGVSGYPFSVVLDTDGTVLARSSGELGQDGIADYVEAALG